MAARKKRPTDPQLASFFLAGDDDADSIMDAMLGVAPGTPKPKDETTKHDSTSSGEGPLNNAALDISANTTVVRPPEPNRYSQVDAILNASDDENDSKHGTNPPANGKGGDDSSSSSSSSDDEQPGESEWPKEAAFASRGPALASGLESTHTPQPEKSIESALEHDVQEGSINNGNSSSRMQTAPEPENSTRSEAKAPRTSQTQMITNLLLRPRNEDDDEVPPAIAGVGVDVPETEQLHGVEGPLLHHMRVQLDLYRSKNRDLEFMCATKESQIVSLKKQNDELKHQVALFREQAPKPAAVEPAPSPKAGEDPSQVVEKLEAQVSYVTSQLMAALARANGLEKDLEIEKAARVTADGASKDRIATLEKQLDKTESSLMESVMKINDLAHKSQPNEEHAAQQAAFSAALEQAMTRVNSLEQERAENLKKNEQLVARIRDDKVKLETAYKQYQDLVDNTKAVQQSMEQLHEKLAKYKAEKGAAVDDRTFALAQLEQVRAAAAKAEKKLRAIKKIIMQLDQENDALDRYAEFVGEKNRTYLRRLTTMYDRVKDEPMLCKSVYGNLAYEQFSERVPNVLGVLQKRGGMNSWKNAYTIIKDNFLLYYKQQSGDPAGVVRLDTSAISVTDDPIKMPCAFILVPAAGKKAEKIFRAKDDADLGRWLAALDVSAKFFIIDVVKPQRTVANVNVDQVEIAEDPVPQRAAPNATTPTAAAAAAATPQRIPPQQRPVSVAVPMQPETAAAAVSPTVASPQPHAAAAAAGGADAPQRPYTLAEDKDSAANERMSAL